MDRAAQRLTLRLAICTVLILALAAYVFLIQGQSPKFDDFNVYYVAGIKAFNHRTVFDAEGHLQFKYSPLVALLFGCTLSLLPYRLASWGYYFASAGLWLSFMALIASDAAAYYRRRLPPYVSASIACWGGVLLFMMFFAVGLRDELKLGQLNIVPIALSYLAFRKQGHDGVTAVKSGILLAVAIQFKLYCLIFLPLLIFRRAWGTLFFTLTSIGMMSFGWLAAFDGTSFAVDEVRQWLATLWLSSRELVTNGFNVSVLGVLTRLFGPQLWVSGIWGAAIAVFLVSAYAMRNSDAIYGCLFAMASILPLNPLAWPYWLLFSAPAFVYVGLPSILGLRNHSPGRRLWLFAVGAALFGFSLQQNQPLAHRWGILAASLLFLTEFMSWFRREVILFRLSPRYAEQVAENLRRSGAVMEESAE